MSWRPTSKGFQGHDLMCSSNSDVLDHSHVATTREKERRAPKPGSVPAAPYSACIAQQAPHAGRARPPAPQGTSEHAITDSCRPQNVSCYAWQEVRPSKQSLPTLPAFLKAGIENEGWSPDLPTATQRSGLPLVQDGAHCCKPPSHLQPSRAIRHSATEDATEGRTCMP